mgnify:CR=1 FL=1
MKIFSPIRLVLAVAALMSVFSAPAFARVEININKGNVEPLPIAITDFMSGDGIGAQVSAVIAADLQRSGLFAPVNKSAFIEKITSPDQQPRFEDWKVINAQALVTGRVTRESDGRLRAEFRLWDTFAGQQMTGQQFFTQPENWRRVAHIIADAIYERLTGEKGYFDTRIVFVDESGAKDRRVKRLAIMEELRRADRDGAPREELEAELAAVQTLYEADVETYVATWIAAARSRARDLGLPDPDRLDEDDVPDTWDPRPVPRPTYTMKARAPQRPAVAPQVEELDAMLWQEQQAARLRAVND